MSQVLIFCISNVYLQYGTNVFWGTFTTKWLGRVLFSSVIRWLDSSSMTSWKWAPSTQKGNCLCKISLEDTEIYGMLWEERPNEHFDRKRIKSRKKIANCGVVHNFLARYRGSVHLNDVKDGNMQHTNRKRNSSSLLVRVLGYIGPHEGADC